MSITLIRIEGADGLGLYRSNKTKLNLTCYDELPNELVEMKEKHSTANPNGMPLPCYDGLDLYQSKKEWFCAFKSLDDFKCWVTEQQAIALVGLGFRVFEITVKEYQLGNKQAVFTKESVTRKKNLSRKHYRLP